MFDAHRHLPVSGEHRPSHGQHIWFATSGPDEWALFQTLSSPPQWKHGYGLLPQWLSEHPHDQMAIFDMVAHVEALLRHDPHGYIGEIGLDERFAHLVPLDVQLSIAGRLLDLADRANRPVAIHHVGSTSLLENLLESADVEIPIIVHGYLGSVETARQLSNRGCTISIGPNVWTHQTKLGKRLAEIDIPFVLETDYPHVPDLVSQASGYEQILASHYREVAHRLHLEQTDLEEKMHGLATILTNW
ncbi:MAG TPA: hypothetical protein DHV69_04955 [Sphaerochaeta sp.]|nr:MAG: hypothetical protein A2Y31_04370 [Spirochaetes bacterium GWC2_52_13]OHD62235.1 MAG: hypothetical protein A2101_03800 [Spirochaetes bacterium GWF2_52_7]PKL21168.1 MAG: hypothetical protein CVV48_09275 [Spirochaetae bacterium HGW-Spirochaetae-4]HCG62590.1 hypothetical protein [Sphaerochaeta sp.]HCJ94561.1 hypothetical protein [Sphaerochaeta sp.]